jgi:hypothetical protein
MSTKSTKTGAGAATGRVRQVAARLKAERVQLRGGPDSQGLKAEGTRERPVVPPAGQGLKSLVGLLAKLSADAGQPMTIERSGWEVVVTCGAEPDVVASAGLGGMEPRGDSKGGVDAKANVLKFDLSRTE